MSTPTAVQPAAETTAITKAEPTISEKFVSKVQRQFAAEMGTPITWTPLQRTLAQHLYVKIDAQLRALDVKRASSSYTKDNPAITWANVNMEKLAVDAVTRVTMELDANLPNMIHVIPYLNKRTQKYDVDLRIGYMGLDHICKKFALDPIEDIKYKLVHETDEFSVLTNDGIEQPHYNQKSPFTPGAVIGGFGYVTYPNSRKNYVHIVEQRDFDKAQKASGGVEFWGGEQTKWENGQKVNAGYDEKYQKEMQFKTVVIRVCKRIRLDSSKINAACLTAIEEARTDAILAEATEIADERANVGEPLALTTREADGDGVVIEEPEIVEDQAALLAEIDEAGDGPGY